MATTTEEARAVDLASKATVCVKSGNLSDAARFLREANTIAPENAQVKAGWLALKEEEARSPLIAICKEWVKKQDEKEGEKALKFIRGQDLSNENAAEAMEILTDFKGEDDMLDQVTGELLANRGAQMWLANALQDRPTETYYLFFERGDDSMDAILRVLLNRSAWPQDATFIQGHRDCFMLSLAMMMEEALEHPERAMKGIATLLSAHAAHLKGIIDADSFDVILASLDARLPSSLRSQATLATIKLLELAPDTAQALISKFVTSRVQRPTADGLIVAFSAAAAIFPITASVASALFLTEGFVSSLVPLVQSKKSQKLELASLELLSAACVDKTCREAINRHCRSWLEDIVAAATDKKRANLAALILVKLGEESSSSGPQIIEPNKVDQDDLIARFKSMVLDVSPLSKQDSIEGLAYASLQPKVRENLANDHQFILRLIDTMATFDCPKPCLFGGLTIFVNLTTYLPIQSEEEKRMSQLKAYANTQKPSEPDPLEGETYVTARCKKVLDAGIVPLLVRTSKRASPSVLSQMLQILLSLSQEKKHRGTIAQQGAVKLLLSIWDHIHAEEHPHASSYTPLARSSAAQSLARILISINPAHVFSTASAVPSTSAIRPLVFLLQPSESSSWQLHAFEALLALTNLASMDTETQDAILRLAFNTVADDLLLSANKLLRRAATELICNLMASPSCVEKYANGVKQSRQRLHVLLAMTDIDDVPTRSAAGGALAMLLDWDLGVQELLKQDRGIDYLLGLCKDENEDVRHRGVVCVRSVVAAPGDIGILGVKIVKDKGGVEVFKEVLKKSRRQEVVGLGAETLKIILG
ncbi:myosin-binding striated muscle assembly central-domain-containing protein [Clohesyomyces aquaticus]|uniref:Myosin-binding striated muscle assembly central-domain-containing protein n=1 Tax=Clohesyomyces aquaticus TaxID=1231657 RepID=A0A1Y1Z9P1_9PLEO|nr:myosin-binding striated muscle assembly central-domain-containing protein [Clohesyomyces aquaticus]